MNPIEEEIIRTFIEPNKRGRYLTLLAGRNRKKLLEKLNGSWDLDRRWVTPIKSKEDVAALLRSKGAPKKCYAISDIPEIDGQELLLEEAIQATEEGEWGTILGCIPGRLAYYRGEYGNERLLLERAV